MPLSAAAAATAPRGPLKAGLAARTLAGVQSTTTTVPGREAGWNFVEPAALSDELPARDMRPVARTSTIRRHPAVRHAVRMHFAES